MAINNPVPQAVLSGSLLIAYVMLLTFVAVELTKSQPTLLLL